MNVKPSKHCLEIGQISKLAEGDPHLTLILNRFGIVFKGLKFGIRY